MNFLLNTVVISAGMKNIKGFERVKMNRGIRFDEIGSCNKLRNISDLFQKGLR